MSADAFSSKHAASKMTISKARQLFVRGVVARAARDNWAADKGAIQLIEKHTEQDAYLLCVLGACDLNLYSAERILMKLLRAHYEENLTFQQLVAEFAKTACEGKYEDDPFPNYVARYEFAPLSEGGEAGGEWKQGKSQKTAVMFPNEATWVAFYYLLSPRWRKVVSDIPPQVEKDFSELAWPRRLQEWVEDLNGALNFDPYDIAPARPAPKQAEGDEQKAPSTPPPSEPKDAHEEKCLALQTPISAKLPIQTPARSNHSMTSAEVKATLTAAGLDKCVGGKLSWADEEDEADFSKQAPATIVEDE